MKTRQLTKPGCTPMACIGDFLEKFVESHFPNHLIVRLPGLVGPGLRKNVIFDFLNNNNLHAIESRGVFQFYPMVNLWYDIQVALNAGLRLVHLTAAPVSVAEVSRQGFGKPFDQDWLARQRPTTCGRATAQIFGAQGAYQYSVRETIQAIRAYAQSEPVTLNPCVWSDGMRLAISNIAWDIAEDEVDRPIVGPLWH